MKEKARLEDLDGLQWTGEGELWLDPKGNDARNYTCHASSTETALGYTWTHEGKEHKGLISWRPGEATFVDSFHSSEEVACRVLPGMLAPLALGFEYEAGEGPPWGWRILLSVRPSDELVVQMTNIAPWGEEARAVRMVFTPDPPE